MGVPLRINKGTQAYRLGPHHMRTECIAISTAKRITAGAHTGFIQSLNYSATVTVLYRCQCTCKCGDLSNSIQTGHCQPGMLGTTSEGGQPPGNAPSDYCRQLTGPPAVLGEMVTCGCSRYPGVHTRRKVRVHQLGACSGRSQWSNTHHTRISSTRRTSTSSKHRIAHHRNRELTGAVQVELRLEVIQVTMA